MNKIVEKSYLFFLGHPAHYHLFKNIIKYLNNKGHRTIVIIKLKDILEELCIQGNINYLKISIPEKSSGLLKYINLFKRYWYVFKLVLKFKPNLLLGSEYSLPLIGKILNVPSILFSEDDVNVIPKLAKITFPFVSTILSPNSCSAGNWEDKKIGYAGYHELAYLHPNNFKAQVENSPYSDEQPYFLLRFAKLTAHHDNHINGLNTETAKKVIEILKTHGQVYISSERELEPLFEQYRVKIDSDKMHHFLCQADLFIGDSQSMAMESAILGIPGIRFNDFVGEISVLEELEHKYQLTCGIKSSEPGSLFQKINEYINTKNLKKEFAIRRKEMLDDKIDVTAFFVWFIENYPESTKIMKENPEYQYNFK